MPSDTFGNPLLEGHGLPPFSRIRPGHVQPAIESLLDGYWVEVDRLLGSHGPYTWDSLVAPLQAQEHRLDRVWSPVNQLYAVADTPELRRAHDACLPLLSAHQTELTQHEGLFQAFQKIADAPGFEDQEPARRKVVENALRDFHLAGVDLPEVKKARYKAIAQELSGLTSRFGQNLLDATQAWRRPVMDEALLDGLPESARNLARDAAERDGLSGWLLTLDLPSYLPVMNYAHDRDLRREMYTAYVTRASDQGPLAGQWDNMPLMVSILALRREQAGLVGYDSFAELSMARKMAATPQEVLEFLSDLASRSRDAARDEFAELEDFARRRGHADGLAAWDVAYFSEALRKARYDFTQEALRPYFPVPKALDGLFQVAQRLFGIQVRPVDGVDVWHPDVTYHEIRDLDGNRRGGFYLDLYARQGKRGGAWMSGLVDRMAATGDDPVASLTCNFTPPVGEEPSLLTHNELTTLFHEFGHGIHHLLTRVDYPGVAGINGVPWDAVELPSQLLENWCWEREALDLFAGHYQTGEPLPGELFEKLHAARNFQSGMRMVRQLEFALFDMRLHLADPAPDAQGILDIQSQVRDQVAVVFPPGFDRFANGFSHVFAGGYAAGYYSYKWAEVLSSDVFSCFEESGIFSRETGLRLLHTVLEQGGSRDPMELFVEFRGRRPRIDALLRHSGIAA